MTDWNPSIVKIEKVEKHPYADALDVCTVLGDYPVVTKCDQFQEGQAACYIPIDSIVPDTYQFYFLCPKNTEKYEEIEGNEIVTKTRQLSPKFPVGSVPEKYRIIKAKKIRGIYSMGMLEHCPIDLTLQLPDGTGWKIGDSIVDLFQLKKWEEEEEESLPSLPRTRGTNAEKAPSGWTIPKYDVNSIRKYLDCIIPNEEILLTEKLHGSNSAFCHDGTRLWCKSRNWFKKQDPEDLWWDLAIRYDLENKLSKFPGFAFFGECVGQVKGFRYDSTIENGKLLTTVHFFDVYDTKDRRYLDYDDRVSMIREAGLSPVPELYRGPWLGKAHAYPYAEGQSTLNAKHIREGVVLVTAKERYEPRLNSRLLLKIVGEGYNLQK